MKNTVILLALTMALAFSTAFSGEPLRNGVVLVAVRDNIMYFKSNRELMGAIIEVHNQNGDLLATYSMNKRKFIIDFIDATPGTYSVIVKKDGKAIDFHYTRMLSSSDTLFVDNESTNLITFY